MSNKTPAQLQPPLVGTYIVWGPEKAPEVHLLAPDLRAILIDRRLSANAHRAADAVRYVFGIGFTEIIAAWDLALLEAIATATKDPVPAEVRALCAAIVIGLPFEEFHKRRGDGGGGSKDRLQPRPTIRPPSGVAVAVS